MIILIEAGRSSCSVKTISILESVISSIRSVPADVSEMVLTFLFFFQTLRFPPFGTAVLEPNLKCIRCSALLQQ
jgi:hypothetical protein